MISIYGLYVDDICFYVGRSNDVERRYLEHKRNAVNLSHPEWSTAKYIFIRGLEEMGIEWRLELIHFGVKEEQDSEYAYVLEKARENQARGIVFKPYDMPLTNMKRGDMLDEMIRIPSITTWQDVKNYRIEKEKKEKEEARNRRRISYELKKEARQNTWTDLDTKSAMYQLAGRLRVACGFSEKKLSQEMTKNRLPQSEKNVIRLLLSDAYADRLGDQRKDFLREAGFFGL